MGDLFWLQGISAVSSSVYSGLHWKTHSINLHRLEFFEGRWFCCFPALLQIEWLGCRDQRSWGTSSHLSTSSISWALCDSRERLFLLTESCEHKLLASLGKSSVRVWSFYNPTLKSPLWDFCFQQWQNCLLKTFCWKQLEKSDRIWEISVWRHWKVSKTMRTWRVKSQRESTGNCCHVTVDS
jgi:hypothetical protein